MRKRGPQKTWFAAGRGGEDQRLSEWKPIETAPKDGSDVLIWCDTGKICIAHFDYATFAWWNDLSTRECPDPTHWMSLPDPPAEVVKLHKESEE
jgi:hypothetical protein